MSDLTIFTEQSARMTSREIAGLVEKRHDNVKRTIETVSEQGVITKPQIEDGIKSANGVVEKVFVFSGDQGKRDSIIVVAQLSPKFTARIVDRWQELEATIRPQPSTNLLPAEIGERTIAAVLRVANLCKVPQSFAIQCAGQAAYRATADETWPKLLTGAEAMNNIHDDEVWLEPTELGKIFDLSAVKINLWLSEQGLQKKVAGEWKLTEKGETIAKRHAWIRGGKSGYNLKWNAAKIEEMFSDTP